MITARTRTVARTSAPVRFASQKQVDLICKLRREQDSLRGVESCDEAINSLSELWQSETVKAASAQIELMISANRELRAAQKAPVAVSAPVAKSNPDDLEAGFYKFGNTVARVQRSKASGHNYALVLDTDSDAARKPFVYEKGAIFKLTAADKLTVEQANEMSLHHGHCMLCGRTLTKKESTQRGIGPVCIKKL